MPPHSGAPSSTPTAYAPLRKPTWRATSAAVAPGMSVFSQAGSTGINAPKPAETAKMAAANHATCTGRSRTDANDCAVV